MTASSLTSRTLGVGAHDVITPAVAIGDWRGSTVEFVASNLMNLWQDCKNVV